MTKEVEVDISEFPNAEVLERVEELIDSKAIKGYHTDEWIEKSKPKIAEMQDKLIEIRKFVLGY